MRIPEYDAILDKIDPCMFDGNIGEGIERQGLPEDLAEALHLYTEYLNNKQHWPTWMVRQYEGMFK